MERMREKSGVRRERRVAPGKERTVVVNLNDEELEKILRRRLLKNYFADTYATATDLRDMCVWGKEMRIPENLGNEWTRIRRRLLAYISPWLISEDSEGELRLRGGGLTDDDLRLTAKNCRDYMLHSVSSEILEGIHPNMATCAYRKSIEAICRVTKRLRRGQRREERERTNRREERERTEVQGQNDKVRIENGDGEIYGGFRAMV